MRDTYLKSIEDRFVPDERGCLIWPGSTKHGYGQVYREGTSQRVHRLIWECYRGEIPEGSQIHHDCGNKRCGNLAHLRCMTQEEHIAYHNPGWKPGHCKRGHLMEGDNVAVNSKGRRKCRECERLSHRKHAAKRAVRHLRCKSGHPRTPENTERTSDGGYRCLDCREARKKPKMIRTHCRNGHERTEENTGHRQGGTFCLLCVAASGQRNRDRRRQAQQQIAQRKHDRLAELLGAETLTDEEADERTCLALWWCGQYGSLKPLPFPVVAGQQC